jgi:hypothetical protein
MDAPKTNFHVEAVLAAVKGSVDEKRWQSSRQ